MVPKMAETAVKRILTIFLPILSYYFFQNRPNLGFNQKSSNFDDNLIDDRIFFPKISLKSAWVRVLPVGSPHDRHQNPRSIG